MVSRLPADHDGHDTHDNNNNNDNDNDNDKDNDSRSNCQRRIMKIMQLNLHKHRERTHGILSDPDSKEFSILMLQEPFWSEYLGECPSHHSWTRYEPSDKRKPPRAAMYVNRSLLPPSEVEQLNIPLTDVVVLRITPASGKEPMLVINVYNPGDESIIQSLHEELKKIPGNKNSIIMVGDFNSHHPSWNPPGYLVHDSSADDIVDLAAELGLILLIPPGTITYPNANTAIDLAWGTSDIENALVKCQIASDNDQGSDHLPVETWISLAESLHNEKARKLDLSRTDWERFREILEEALPSTAMTLGTANEIDASVATLLEAIQTAITETTPTKRPMPHSKRWWNKELTAMRRTANKLRNRYRRSGLDVDKAAWREKANEYTKAISEAKETMWRKFVNAADGKSIWEIKKYIDGKARQAVVPTLDGNASYSNMANALHNAFFPPPPRADLSDLRNPAYPAPVETECAAAITIEQIRHAVARTAPNKAPGPDGVTNKVLHQAMRVPGFDERLQRILQASVDRAYFPKAFRTTTTVVVRKPGKPDYTKAKAYRPIALENTIGKVFESVVAETLSFLTETHNLLPETHYGGRPGRSTEDALLELTERIHKAWKQKKVFSAVFLDVAGAFNNVHHARLLHNLRMRRIPTSLVAWIGSFLEKRTTRLHFNGKASEEICTPAGVPQGSPLSPLLYMYYNAGLLHAGPGDLALGFIDDIVYGTAGKTDKGNATKLKRALGKADEWKKQHGAQFEESKYVLVHFTRNRQKSTNAAITLRDGMRIEPAAQARYLGVILDKALNFKAHIQHAVKKGTEAALALGGIGRATWGASHEYIRQLFLTVVATRMDYAAMVWHGPRANGSMEASAAMRKFSTVQRVAMKAVTGCYRTTPTAAMEREAGLPPPWIRLQTKVLSAAARMKSLSLNHPCGALIEQGLKAATAGKRPVHCSILENLAMEFPKFMAKNLERSIPHSSSPPWHQEAHHGSSPWPQGHPTAIASPHDHEAPPRPWDLPTAMRSPHGHEVHHVTAEPPHGQQALDHCTAERTTKATHQREAKAIAKTLWDELWNKPNPTTAITLRRMTKVPGTTEGPSLYKGMPRPAAATLAQLRTGHCGLNQYLWRFKKADDAACGECGYQKETVEHFLTECPAYHGERKDLEEAVGPEAMTVAFLLGNRSAVKATMEFVKKTGRLKA